MPKMKTHKATAKRVRTTGTGKLMRAKAGKRHNLEWKPTSLTRRMDGMTEVAKADVPRLKRLLGDR
jgi:large subunit ribosomal protein L35